MHASMTDQPIPPTIPPTVPPMMKSPRTRRLIILFVVAALFFIGAILAQPWNRVQPVAAPTPQPSARYGKGLSVQESIDQMQMRIERNDQDYDAYAELGLLLLQRVRVGADAADYQRADQALSAALKLEPNEVDALVGKGILSLALHDFRSGLAWGEKGTRHQSLAPRYFGGYDRCPCRIGRV